MCVLYIEVVVCVYAYGHLIWRVVYTYICVYTMLDTHTHIPYSAKFSRCIIFAVFADSSRTAKIKLLETFW